MRKYKCIKPLKMRHLYTKPDVLTILPEWGRWVVTNRNRIKGTVELLLHDNTMQTRAVVTDSMFAEYFEIVN